MEITEWSGFPALVESLLNQALATLVSKVTSAALYFGATALYRATCCNKMSLCSSSQNTFLSYLSPNGAGNLLKTGFYTFFYLSNLCARKRLRRGKIQSTSSGMCCAPSGFWRHHFIKGALLQHYLRQDILSMHYMPFPFFFHSEAGAFSDPAGAVIAASCSVSWVCGVGHQVPWPSSHPHLRHTGEQQDTQYCSVIF